MNKTFKATAIFLAVIIAAMFFNAGCAGKIKKAPTKPSGKPETKKKLVIGLIPERNIFVQRQRYEPVFGYLAKKLGIKIEIKMLPRYGNVIDNFVERKLDGAIFGSFTYSLAKARLGVEALARPVNLDGSSKYWGYIIVRKDSGIRNVADMKGKSFAFVDKATTAGYLFPLAYFKQHGVEDMRKYLGKIFFTGSHDAAVMAVYNGEADVGAVKNTVYDTLANEDPKLKESFLILAQSAKVPLNALAVKPDLGPTLKKRMKLLLLDLDKSPAGKEVLKKFKAKKFIPTTDKDYLPVINMAKEAGVNLKTYEYENK
jgi:phosphonate transport system substrate-binding protein